MPPEISACPGNPKGGHWWICDAPVSRLSHAFCKLCGAERDDLANYPDEVYGHVISHRKEVDLALSGDERLKRHQFYEDNKELVITTYKETGGKVKEAARILTKQLKVKVPKTTLYGLLRQWKVKKIKRPKKSKGKGRKARAVKQETKAVLQGQLIGLEKVDGGYKVTVLVEVQTSLTWEAMCDSLRGPVNLEIL